MNNHIETLKALLNEIRNEEHGLIGSKYSLVMERASTLSRQKQALEAFIEHIEGDRWIPVSERLPYDEELVWCYGLDLESEPDDQGCPPLIFGDGQFYRNCGNVHFYGIEGHVTHWKKPQPPEASDA